MSSLVAPPFGSWMERMRFRLYGVIFIIVAALLVVLMVAFYEKTFVPVYHVTLKSDRAGLQLIPHSDVKVRGLIVGEVRGIDIAPDGGAVIDMAIKPDKAHLIPSNSVARLLPKTAFGEKFVDIVPPPSEQQAAPLREGSVLAQDRSAMAVEVTKVLDDLLPVLQAVKPDKLNSVLNAVATAVQGRGDQLGQTVDEANDLLPKINKQLPTLVHNLKAVGTVADTVNAAAPDLVQLLRNLQVTNRTVVDKQDVLADAISRGIGATENAREFVQANESKIVGVGISNARALQEVAKYSPLLPCVINGLAKIRPNIEQALGGGQPGLHLTIEIVKPRPGYKPGLDRPENTDQRNPRCYGLPNPKVPFPAYQMLDGTQDDLWYKGALPQPPKLPLGRSTSGVFFQPSAATTGDDNETIKSLMAPVLETPADQVPDIAALLFSPLASGSVVQVG